jgi:acetyl esterase/lipase
MYARPFLLILTFGTTVALGQPRLPVEEIVANNDLNGDGAVTQDEWEANNRPMAMFAILDSNSDGVFTVDELQAFSGSEALTGSIDNATTVSSVIYDESRTLTYDLMQPAQQNGAAVLILMSGGFRTLRGPLRESFTASHAGLLDEGFTLIAVNHRDTGNGPDALSDVRRAVRHIRLNAERYGIDADRIGVTGASSGGQLALLLGVASDAGQADSADPVNQMSDAVAAVVAQSPPVDFAAFVDHLNQNHPEIVALSDPNGYVDRASDISPHLFVDSSDPPTLLIHGDADELALVSHSQLMFAELQAEGVASDFIVLADVGHEVSADAVIDRSGHPFLGDRSNTVGEATVDWFKRYLLDR